MPPDATLSPFTAQQDWMTTDEFNDWFRRLGLGESDLARRLDVKQPTINRWRNGERRPPGYLWRALEHLQAELERERKRKRRTQPPRGSSAGEN